MSKIMYVRHNNTTTAVKAVMDIFESYCVPNLVSFSEYKLELISERIDDVLDIIISLLYEPIINTSEQNYWNEFNEKNRLIKIIDRIVRPNFSINNIEEGAGFTRIDEIMNTNTKFIKNRSNANIFDIGDHLEYVHYIDNVIRTDLEYIGNINPIYIRHTSVTKLVYILRAVYRIAIGYKIEFDDTVERRYLNVFNNAYMNTSYSKLIAHASYDILDSIKIHMPVFDQLRCTNTADMPIHLVNTIRKSFNSTIIGSEYKSDLEEFITQSIDHICIDEFSSLDIKYYSDSIIHIMRQIVRIDMTLANKIIRLSTNINYFINIPLLCNHITDVYQYSPYKTSYNINISMTEYMLHMANDLKPHYVLGKYADCENYINGLLEENILS